LLFDKQSCSVEEEFLGGEFIALEDSSWEALGISDSVARGSDGSG
jgi:hypothetical protein